MNKRETIVNEIVYFLFPKQAWTITYQITELIYALKWS